MSRYVHESFPKAKKCVDNVNIFLLVVHRPIDLVVVPGPQVNHHVLVSEEEHDSHWVVQLVHSIEVWDLCHEKLHTRACENKLVRLGTTKQ